MKKAKLKMNKNNINFVFNLKTKLFHYTTII